MSIIVTPQIVRRIEDNMRYILVSAWARRDKNAWWRRLMKTRTSGTKKELLQWMLETAQITAQGNGGNYTQDDLTEIYWEIENENAGASLTLTEDEISDGEAFNRAGQWAKHMGASGAYWPQEKATYLLKNGKTLTGYDGKAFFATDHPVNPYIGAASGTYANLFTNRPFSTTNLAYITAQIEAIDAPDGKKRHLMPRIVAAGPDLRYDVTQALGAEQLADPNDSSGASGSNVIKSSYGFEAPLITADLDEAGVWYLGCELIEDDELGGLIYQERQAFTMNSYSPMSDADLALKEEFLWRFKGRNAASYGHPFLLFRIEPS